MITQVLASVGFQIHSPLPENCSSQNEFHSHLQHRQRAGIVDGDILRAEGDVPRKGDSCYLYLERFETISSC